MKDNNVDLIINQIKKDAEQQADLLLQTARRNAELRIRLAQGEAKRIRKEQINQGEQKMAAIKQRMLATVGLETKRIILEAREEIINKVITKVKEREGKFLAAPDYRRWLKKAIVNGVKQLGESEAIVIISKADEKLVNQELFSEIKREINEEIRISLDPDNKLEDAGTIIKSVAGRKLIDNSLTTCLDRLMPQLRLQIAEQLFN